MTNIMLPLCHSRIVLTEHLTILSRIDTNLHLNTVFRKKIQLQSHTPFRYVFGNLDGCLVPVVVSRFLPTRRILNLPSDDEFCSWIQVIWTI